MGTALRLTLLIAGVVAFLGLGAWLYLEKLANPRVVRELLEDPHGARARQVMLVTLPSGRRIPVNYLREGDRIYAGADGRWWRELVGDGFPVRVVVRGEELRGSARAVLDEPAHREEVFAKLRPNAVKGFGTLVEIQLEDEAIR